MKAEHRRAIARKELELRQMKEQHDPKYRAVLDLVDALVDYGCFFGCILEYVVYALIAYFSFAVYACS